MGVNFCLIKLEAKHNFDLINFRFFFLSIFLSLYRNVNYISIKKKKKKVFSF